MAMRQPDLDEPPAIIASLHQDGVPVIEVTHQVNGFCPARRTVEIDWFDGILYGIDPIARFVTRGVHK